MEENPEWLQLGDGILGPLLADASKSLQTFSGGDFHVTQLPTLSLFHLAHSLQTSIEANREGRHAVALSLLRHAVEAITIVELGVVANDFAYRLLQDWGSGRKSQGELRRALEQRVWPSYGTGLWNEPWAEFFGGLARAVQPYAHCSPELIQWNLAALGDGTTGPFVAGAGMYDPMKASRLTLFHVLVTWTLGRILCANPNREGWLVSRNEVQALGAALLKSGLLIEGENWPVQLWPHMFLRR
jgi:hypothetical protein